MTLWQRVVIDGETRSECELYDCRLRVEKLQGVSVDGYLAAAIDPQGRWFSARCATEGKARSWCIERATNIGVTMN